QLAALRGAVGALAIGGEMAAKHAPLPVARRGATVPADGRAMAAEAAGPALDRRTVGGAEIGVANDRPTGGVAILQRQRTTHDLDPVQRTQREVRRLALPVQRGRRDAIDHQPDAADAEGRTRTETAALDLQVLGEV